MPLVIKIILSCFGLIFLIDIVLNLFAGKKASDITNSLCRPLFGCLYPHVTMVVGLFIWLIEFGIVISAIWLWIK